MSSSWNKSRPCSNGLLPCPRLHAGGTDHLYRLVVTIPRVELGGISIAACPPRFLTYAIAVFLLVSISKPSVASPSDFAKDLQPFLNAYCIKCHNADKQESDFRIDKLSQNVVEQDGPQWAEVMERISSGEMPPKKAPHQPTAVESSTIVTWISARLKEGELARLAARGRVSFNRLTRDEYVNTMRDLIGVHFDATDPGGFLEDPEWHGFERIGSVMTLSASNIEKYLAAAEFVLAEAYPKSKPAFFESTKKALLEKQIDEPHREQLRVAGLLDKVRFEMWPGDIFRYSGPEQPLPDDELFALAELGKLHDRAELSRQVARMLADPRAHRFTDSFASEAEGRRFRRSQVNSQT